MYNQYSDQREGLSRKPQRVTRPEYVTPGRGGSPRGRERNSCLEVTTVQRVKMVPRREMQVR